MSFCCGEGLQIGNDMVLETILVEQRGRVGLITLNRPDQMNAFNASMNLELREQIDEFNENDTVGAILITGSGRAFSAGADIEGFEATVRGEKRTSIDPVSRFPKWPLFIKESKPVICAINGYAIGMGITLPLGCDIIVMAQSAKISFRFAYIGLTPEYGSSHLLTQTVGIGKAMEFMLTGRFIDAGEALQTNLVNHVYADDELIEKAIDLCDSIAFNPSWQLSQIKRMMRDHQLLDDIDTVMETERDLFSRSQQTDSHREFLLSFREKRKPNYHKNIS